MTALKRHIVALKDRASESVFRWVDARFYRRAPKPKKAAFVEGRRLDFDSIRADIRRRYGKTLDRLAM